MSRWQRGALLLYVAVIGACTGYFVAFGWQPAVAAIMLAGCVGGMAIYLKGGDW